MAPRDYIIHPSAYDLGKVIADSFGGAEPEAGKHADPEVELLRTRRAVWSRLLLAFMRSPQAILLAIVIGLVAPARTPPAIVAQLNEQIVKALQDPATRDLLVNQAMQTVGNTPAAFAAFIARDIATWKAVAADAKVTVE